MVRMLIGLLFAGLLAGCDGDGMPSEETDAGVAQNCCVQYASGLSVPGCWMCGSVLRCVGTTCESMAATMPLCTVQPSAAWTAEHPNCD